MFSIKESPLMETEYFLHTYVIPEQLLELSKEDNCICIAGGSLVPLIYPQAKDGKDIDFFILQNEYLDKPCAECAQWLNDQLMVLGYYIVDDQKSVKTYAHPQYRQVQIICKRCESVKELIQQFDILQCGVGYKGGTLYWIDLDGEQPYLLRLSAKGMTQPVYKVMRRLVKYCRKGFDISTALEALASYCKKHESEPDVLFSSVNSEDYVNPS
jgi:hypothetical protein